MNAVARFAVVVAVAGHFGLTMADALARPGAAAAGPGTSGPGAGVSGPSAAAGGHYGSVGGYGGNDGGNGHGDPAPAPGHSAGGPPIFSYQPDFNGFTANAGGCGTELQLPDTSWYTDHVAGIEVISQQTQNYLSSCGCNTQTCVADALDKYATALDEAVEPAPPPPGLPPTPPHRLPKAVRELPRIVHEAATRVRAAKTPQAAQKAVQEAIEIVQKTAAKAIPLMRAADPDAQAAVTRGASLVADTLTAAKTALERADTL